MRSTEVTPLSGGELLIFQNLQKLNSLNLPVGSGMLGNAPATPVSAGESPYTPVSDPTHDHLYLVEAGAAADTVLNLPPATGSAARIIVKKTDANPFNVAITPNGTDTIDGVNAPVNITIQYDVIHLEDTAAGAWSVY